MHSRWTDMVKCMTNHNDMSIHESRVMRREMCRCVVDNAHKSRARRAVLIFVACDEHANARAVKQICHEALQRNPPKIAWKIVQRCTCTHPTARDDEYCLEHGELALAGEVRPSGSGNTREGTVGDFGHDFAGLTLVDQVVWPEYTTVCEAARACKRTTYKEDRYATSVANSSEC